MRRVAIAAAASILAVAVSPIEAAAQAPACTQMQVFLSIAPQHREHVMAYIAPRLRERHNVELVAEAIGSANMVERITAQGANPRVTIAQWDVPIGIAACQSGLCTPIDFARAPNLQRLYDWAVTRSAENQPVVLATNVLGVGIIYNEREFQRANLPPPTSWNDLTRADLRGRLAITAPQSTMGTAALAMLARLNGGGEANIEPGFAATQRIMANEQTIFTWTSELSNLLQLGQIWMAVTSSNIAPAQRAQGVPMRFVMPREGSPTVNGGLSLVRGAPCQEAAYTYLELYYSDEFQALRMREGGTASPTRTSWERLTPAERTELGISPEDFPRLVNFDWDRVNRDRPEWIRRWQREIR